MSKQGKKPEETFGTESLEREKESEINPGHSLQHNALSEAREVEVPREDVREKVVFSLGRLAKFKPQDFLRAFSMEYRVILALYEEIANSDDLNFEQMQRKALDYIDEKFDLYRRKFGLPDDLVSLPVTCREGVYYLSLCQGYLTFYAGNRVGKRLRLRLVDHPQNLPTKPKN